MNWKDRHVLVTGAGGFIGSHLVERLAAEGEQVRALVHYNSRNDPGLLKLLPDETLAALDVLPADLLDPFAVLKAVEGVEVVFHLGALISIPYSYRHPYHVAQTNVMGTLNLLDACRAAGVERLVHTSSSEVYGTAQYVPIDETHPLQGQSPYSASKIGADKLAESYYATYALPVVTLRPFNTYGPRQSDRAVIPTIISQALTREVIHLGNLEARRDLTYVADTVEGFLKVAGAAGVEGQVFNLGVGQEITIGELVKLILQIVGRDVRVEVEPQRLRPEKSEVERLLSNNQRAGEVLGWSPQVSIEDGLRRTIDWIKDHLDLYTPDEYRV
ncbi:MAG: NAD-dependent epimerase/dehydratase family protein [Lysobacterales bacterium]|nr:MAG: NAD-dependent epimerase/dehydratase family protein [Xanthomonadales bacterium]